MLNFLNPAILFAGAAALIPLIIHLFSRRKVKVVEFSSLKHLKAMQKRQVRRLKVRQLLLLVIRTLLILSVVLAFARPTTKGGAVGSHAGVSAVVVFDNSASMNRYVADGRLFDLAKRRTEELLGNFGQTDQVALIPVAGGTSSAGVAYGSSAVALEQLRQLEPGHTYATLNQSLGSAAELLASAGNFNREVYVVSDRQRAVLPEKPLLQDDRATAYLVDLPESEISNSGITALDLGGQLVLPGHEFAVTATVHNYSAQSSGDQIASLFFNGRRVSQTSYTAGAGGDAAVRLTATIPQTGFYSGYVEIADDMFADDNRYYFSFSIPDRFSVLIVDGDPCAQFVELALAPSPDQQLFWSAKRVTPELLGEVNVSDYNCIVLAGIPNLPEGVVSDIKSAVRRGRGLLLIYGERTDVAYANRVWGTDAGFNIESAAPAVVTRSGYYTLKSIETNHPIFSVFGFTGDKIPDMKFYSLPKIAAEQSAQMLMRFSGDRPALIESSVDRGKILTFAGPIGPDYSDMVSHGFFVPFVSRTAEYLSANLSSFDIRLYTDGNIVRTLSPGPAVTTALDMVAPDSSSWSILPEESGGSVLVHPTPIELPGSYSLFFRGKEVDRFAVNVNPNECDLSAIDHDQFASALGVAPAKVIALGTTVAQAVSGFRVGRELWPIFAWLAVILLAAEMILGRGAAAPQEE